MRDVKAQLMTIEHLFIKNATEWRKKALSVSLAFGASSDQAEDVAQDTMLKLWQMRTELAQYHNIGALVTVMARNITISMHRKQAGEALNEAMNTLADSTPNPEQQLMGREAVKHIEQRLQELPSRQQAVLIMRQVEKRSYREIGSLLGIEEASAKVLLSRARKWLLNELSKE